MTAQLRRIAMKTALKSRHPQHKMACIITAGGKVISAAANDRPGRGHAERRAVRAHDNYRGASALVVRLNGNGCSKPCPDCWKLLVTAGISTIQYTDRQGFLVTQRLPDLGL